MKTNYVAALAWLLASGALYSSSAMPYCAETITEVNVDQVTALGFSGQDLIDKAARENNLPWTWDYKNGSTSLTMTTGSFAQKARYIDSVAVYPDGVPDTRIICADRVEVDAWVNFSTDDGAFNEHWHTVLYDTDGTDCMPEIGDRCVPPGEEANFAYGFSRESLTGSFYKEVTVPADLTLDFYAHGTFSEGAVAAHVGGIAHGCGVDGNDACYAFYIYGGHSW